MLLLVKLIIAHLVGDFILQPSAWVRAKELKKVKSWQLYVHILIHGAIMFALLGIENWVLILLIAASHLLIDGVKLYAQSQPTKRIWFFVDQTLHIAAIVVVWLAFNTTPVRISYVDPVALWILITAFVFITTPSSVIIKTLISHWSPETISTGNQSLADAGKFIGVLERSFVFTFVILQRWEAVGFLLAAKSIFRFGDLRDAHDRKLTEYVLIGTLISFGMAICMGLLIHYLIISKEGNLDSLIIFTY